MKLRNQPWCCSLDPPVPTHHPAHDDRRDAAEEGGGCKQIGNVCQRQHHPAGITCQGRKEGRKEWEVTELEAAALLAHSVLGECLT